MKALTQKFCGAVLTFALAAIFAPADAQQTNLPKFSTEELARRTLERRAVDAAIWGMPMVSLDALRQAYYRDGKAKNGDIIWWPKGSTWKNQSLTPNTSLRYLYVFVNTKDEGPVVLDLPPEANGSSFLGMGIRSILASNSPEDEQKGDALVKQIKVYPLAKATNPPTQRFVDMTDTMYNGLVRYDESIYTSLARMLNEEPVQPEDLQMMGMLLPLGIEKGKDFKPDAATVAQLKSAAAEAHAWLLAKQPTFVEDWWSGSHWKVPIAAIGPQTGFKWTVANYFDIDSRGIAFFSFFLPPAKLGGGSFYLAANLDSSAQSLRGENNYRLRVPANVPVSQFWAVTIYNSETSALILDLPRPTLDSLDKGLRKNADGSVDIYFGPKAPAGQESNWIFTPAGTSWFPWFRFYGPEKAVFNKSWKMTDIEQVK